MSLMALDSQQRQHVERLLIDSKDLRTGAERNRVARIAQDMLDGIVDWPNPKLEAHEIHDYIEKTDDRTFWDDKLVNDRPNIGDS